MVNGERELARCEQREQWQKLRQAQHDWQAEVARTVHDRMGVWTASHYMLPGLAHDMDGQTHVSATTRLGFPYTRSAAGISYDDMLMYARAARVPLYFIGIALGITDIAGTNKMKSLAAETGGVAYFIKDANKLTDTYTQLEAWE